MSAETICSTAIHLFTVCLFKTKKKPMIRIKTFRFVKTYSSKLIPRRYVRCTRICYVPMLLNRSSVSPLKRRALFLYRKRLDRFRRAYRFISILGIRSFFPLRPIVPLVPQLIFPLSYTIGFLFVRENGIYTINKYTHGNNCL